MNKLSGLISFVILNGLLAICAVSNAQAMGTRRIVDETSLVSTHKQQIVRSSCKVYFGWPLSDFQSGNELALQQKIAMQLESKGYQVVLPEGSGDGEDFIADGKVDEHLVLMGESKLLLTNESLPYGCGLDLKLAQWSGRSFEQGQYLNYKLYTSLNGRVYELSNYGDGAAVAALCDEYVLKMVSAIPQCIEVATEFAVEPKFEVKKSTLPKCKIQYGYSETSIYIGAQRVLTFPNVNKPACMSEVTCLAGNKATHEKARVERDKLQSQGICQSL
jgi:hypothetical protein